MRAAVTRDRCIAGTLVHRFDAGHRRNLAARIQQARAVDAAGAAPALAEDLAALAEPIEPRLFREEPRPAPMMAQDGNAQVGQPIDALRAESHKQEDRAAALQAQVDSLTRPAGPALATERLHAKSAERLPEQAEHIYVEDEILFRAWSVEAPGAPFIRRDLRGDPRPYRVQPADH